MPHYPTKHKQFGEWMDGKKSQFAISSSIADCFCTATIAGSRFHRKPFTFDRKMATLTRT